MTKYGLRARVITLTLAPTLIIGLLLSALFSFNRYYDLETQVVTAGSNIIEPLAIASEEALKNQNRELVRQIISYTHRKNSQFVRSIAVFDAKHELFVTSNFHPNFEVLTYSKEKAIPLLSSRDLTENTLILRTPILQENQAINDNKIAPALGYIAIELDLSSLRLQQYQEIFSAFLVLILGLGLSGMFAFRLMHDVTRPISHMKNMVDRIRRGHLDVRIEGKMHGELDSLKKGINAMAMSLSEYHVEMQHSIDQATSDLRETLEQLEIQNIELDIAKKRAQEAARIKSEFLANMSHELRTPLNGVIGFTRQILKTPLSNSQADYLQTIEKSADNLLKIINDILDFSKLEAGKLTLEKIPFECQECLEEIVTLQATSAHEKGLEITLKIDPKIPTGLIGDPLRIQQVLTNLVGNSIKFTERGNVDISVELRSQKEDIVELQFIVKDTGIGISERQQAQLFQAFSQADASISRRYGGTGLGLVITQKLVSQMGGEISLTSRLHQGSTFWFTLRLHATELPINDWIDPHILQQKQLLLIESNDQVASILQQTLGEAGLIVTRQTTLSELQKGDRFDYVLLNLIPNRNTEPHDVERMVEQAMRLSNHVIVGTPSTELALADHLMQCYPIKCITKPLSHKKLLTLLISQQPKRITEDRAEANGEHPALLPLTVMAVDDNPANLKLIVALLQERVENIVACTNGLDAIEHARTQSFDMILMDIQMPHVDGVTASKAIKQTALNTDTPIIAVTAHAMLGERERLLQAGMDDYLTKPIEEPILQRILTEWNLKDSSNSPSQLPATECHNSVSDFTHDESLPLIEYQIDSTLIVDWQAALKQAAKKEGLAKELLSMLVDSIPEVSQIVTSALESGHYSKQELLHHIHKLHGSCSYSGVPRLKNVCGTLETLLRSRPLDAEDSIQDIEPELLELHDEMEKVVNAAKPYLV